jgi:PAS domain S-box-containing protein
MGLSASGLANRSVIGSRYPIIFLLADHSLLCGEPQNQVPNERPRKPDSPAPDRFAFSTFIDALPDAIVIVDRSGRIVELNIQAVRLFGYARSELLGEPVEMLLPERLRSRHVGERDRYNQSPHVRPMGAEMSLLARHKDGHEFPVEISLGPYQSADGPLVVSTIRDLTARPRARQPVVNR